MSYTAYPPDEFAFWLSQQVQQGSLDPFQALSNQFSVPQYHLPRSSRAATCPPFQQGQVPTASFPTNTTSAYPTVPMPMPYQIPSLSVQYPQIPFPYTSTSLPAYGSLENVYCSVPQYNEPVQSGTRPNEDQQALSIRTLQQNPSSAAYESQSPATHLTTVHPSLGLCVLVPLDQLRASAPPSTPNWSTVNNAGSRHGDYSSNRVDRLRRRHSRSLTPFMRSMTPSPHRSPTLSPYLSSPSSSVTMTPVLRRRRHNTPEFARSPGHFHGIGGFTPLRRAQSVASVPRVTREASISTVGTCSQCGGAVASDPYEPFSDGSVVVTPRVVHQDAIVGQGESSRGRVEVVGDPAEGESRFQASVEEVDD